MLYFSASQELQFLKLLLRSYVRPFICCSSQLQVCVALQFFASGTFQINCGDEINVSQASTSRYIRDVSLGLQAIFHQGFRNLRFQLIITPPTFKVFYSSAKRNNGILCAIDEYYTWNFKYGYSLRARYTLLAIYASCYSLYICTRISRPSSGRKLPLTIEI